MRLAIIIPVLDEGGIIAASLAALQPLRARGVRVIVVDGGSTRRHGRTRRTRSPTTSSSRRAVARGR